jgi:hypothetical protein
MSSGATIPLNYLKPKAVSAARLAQMRSGVKKSGGMWVEQL